jgi:hypothetical protein
MDESETDSFVFFASKHIAPLRPDFAKKIDSQLKKIIQKSGRNSSFVAHEFDRLKSILYINPTSGALTWLSPAHGFLSVYPSSRCGSGF